MGGFNVVWALKLYGKTEEKLERLKKICQDISDKDERFTFIVKDKDILIPVKDKNSGFRKGMWFHHKTDVGPHFNVEWKKYL